MSLIGTKIQSEQSEDGRKGNRITLELNLFKMLEPPKDLQHLIFLTVSERGIVIYRLSARRSR